MQYGVDVSSYQGGPGDWAALASGCTWAAVKFSELSPAGEFLDEDAPADWSWLKDRGMGRIAYLFGRPGQPVDATVDLFGQACQQCGLEDTDGICLDLEVSMGLSAAAVAQWARDVMALLKTRFGRTPLLYTYLSFAWAGNCAGLGEYPLWISAPSSPPGRPAVPAPWTSWLIHQYVITGPVDRDLAAWTTNGEMTLRLGKPGAVPQPEPTREQMMQDLGGDFAGQPACARWENSGVIVVAAVDKAGDVLARRWDGKTWSQWRKISPFTARGGVSILTFGSGDRRDGRLYYTAATGHVIELGTTDAGATWA